MKKTVLILSLAIAAALAGCHSNESALQARRADVSWRAFCAARGYDLNDNTYQATDEYLDTWCGSADEEAAFIAAGVKPY